MGGKKKRETSMRRGYIGKSVPAQKNFSLQVKGEETGKSRQKVEAGRSGKKSFPKDWILRRVSDPLPRERGIEVPKTQLERLADYLEKRTKKERGRSCRGGGNSKKASTALL